eukprot:9407680-Karenia_brevis.AAC.1
MLDLCVLCGSCCPGEGEHENSDQPVLGLELGVDDPWMQGDPWTISPSRIKRSVKEEKQTVVGANPFQPLAPAHEGSAYDHLFVSQWAPKPRTPLTKAEKQKFKLDFTNMMGMGRDGRMEPELGAKEKWTQSCRKKK